MFFQLVQRKWFKCIIQWVFVYILMIFFYSQMISASITSISQSSNLTLYNNQSLILKDDIIRVNENIINISQIYPTISNSNDQFTYKITGGSDQLHFSINENTGDLKFNKSKSYEFPEDSNQDNRYIIEIKVTNQENLSDTATFTVIVVDVNEPPTDITSETDLMFNENTQPFVESLQLIGVDEDMANGQELTFKLLSVKGTAKRFVPASQVWVDDEAFDLKSLFNLSLDGVLKATSVLNHEALDNGVSNVSSVILRVKVSDGLGFSFSKDLTLIINDNNDPINIDVSDGLIDEIITDQSYTEESNIFVKDKDTLDVVRFNVYDEDHQYPNTYTLTEDMLSLSGEDKDKYRLKLTKEDYDMYVELRVVGDKTTHNYEDKNQHLITLTATDKHNSSDSEDIVINLVNQNDPPTMMFISTVSNKSVFVTGITEQFMIKIFDEDTSSNYDGFANYTISNDINSDYYSISYASIDKHSNIHIINVKPTLNLFETSDTWGENEKMALNSEDSISGALITFFATDKSTPKNRLEETFTITEIRRNSDGSNETGADNIWDAEDNDDDGDLLLDQQEQQFNYNPKNPYSKSLNSQSESELLDSQKDYDFDGITNYDELNGTLLYNEKPAITSAISADSDNDGLGDLFEITAKETGYSLVMDKKNMLNTIKNPYSTDPNNKDTDNDGIIDGREVLGFLYTFSLKDRSETVEFTTNPISKDTDGDGLNDNIELGWAGTSDDDILDTSNKIKGRELTFSYEKVSSYADGNPSTVSTQSKKEYTINNLVTDPTLVDTDGDGISDNDELTPTRTEFYIDFTKDGINNPVKVELDIITDPTKKDTDEDGISDSEELSNEGPYPAVTNPSDKDTDNDGLSDKDEQDGLNVGPVKITYELEGKKKTSNIWFNSNETKTDPLNIDFDLDGLSDGQEIRNIYYLNEKVYLNPTLADTDKDGLLDGEEGITQNITFNIQKRKTEIDDINNQFEFITLSKPIRTNPLNYDTDGDLIDDSDELFMEEFDPVKFQSGELQDLYKTDPTLTDTDEDGLSDYQESVIGHDLMIREKLETVRSNPTYADSDIDNRYSDLEEINGYKLDIEKYVTEVSQKKELKIIKSTEHTIQTSPVHHDTDGDGIPDVEERGGWEIEINNQPNILVKSSGNSKDTDDDGISDFLEKKGYKMTGYTDNSEFSDILIQTNPSSCDTDGDQVLDLGEKIGRDLDENGSIDSLPTLGNDRDSDNDGLPDLFDDEGLNSKVDTVELTYSSKSATGVNYFLADYPINLSKSPNYAGVRVKYKGKESFLNHKIAKVEMIIYSDYIYELENNNCDIAIKFPNLSSNAIDSVKVEKFKVKPYEEGSGDSGYIKSMVINPSDPQHIQNIDYSIISEKESTGDDIYFKNNSFPIFSLTGKIGGSQTSTDEEDDYFDMITKKTGRKITIEFKVPQDRSAVGFLPYGLFLIKKYNNVLYEHHLPNQMISDNYLNKIISGDVILRLYQTKDRELVDIRKISEIDGSTPWEEKTYLQQKEFIIDNLEFNRPESAISNQRLKLPVGYLIVNDKFIFKDEGKIKQDLPMLIYQKVLSAIGIFIKTNKQSHGSVMSVDECINSRTYNDGFYILSPLEE
ncbi:hypothetical protein DID75_02495 [Candidatus Marinamargulisbacteria bacterium SCGC AG-410-N11]|nr:hypothetical protein DID75_02495 [Candidatus Marinamargulisbacteria bacterium SCGC AG-410-N11]